MNMQHAVTDDSVGLVITTRNEAETIGSMVSMAYKIGGWQAVVVDEGSTDATAMIARDKGAQVMYAPFGSGIGPALMLGWRELLLDRRIKHIIQMDAGGSHFLMDARHMLVAAQRADVVIGSRFMKGSYYFGSPSRWAMSKIAAMMCSFKIGVHFTDWTSGFRVFSRHAVETLLRYAYHGKMHEWQIEVLRNAYIGGLTIIEEPITYRGGRSSFNHQVALTALEIWRQL